MQESECRSQNAGIRIQESEYRSQNTGVRIQESELLKSREITGAVASYEDGYQKKDKF